MNCICNPFQNHRPTSITENVGFFSYSNLNKSKIEITLLYKCLGDLVGTFDMDLVNCSVFIFNITPHYRPAQPFLSESATVDNTQIQFRIWALTNVTNRQICSGSLKPDIIQYLYFQGIILGQPVVIWLVID
jgi:hypothetical protein